MDNAGSIHDIAHVPEDREPEREIASAGEEMRAAPRLTLLIRAAKLVSSNGEFVCIVRDVSDTGLSVRLFHNAPTGEEFELQMAGGASYDIKSVWTKGREAGFEFPERIDALKLLAEADEYPKRGLRLDLCFPVCVTTLEGTCKAVVENFSQQGARLESEGLFAIDQSIRIKSMAGAATFDEVRAKVRWRRDSQYGVVFDDTFTLENFARLAAKVQAPGLLR
ncbi:MAG: PilZ domain-containing protein [Erythrobacter sp.]